MGAADRLGAGFRQAEMPHFAFLDQLFHRAGDVLDRHLRIDAMLIEQIDRLDAQAPQRPLDDLSDVVGPAVEAVRSRREDREAELGGDDDLAAERRQRLADQSPRW